MGCNVGRGCPLPTEEGVWGGGCAPSPEIFVNFFWLNVFKKILCSGQRGGHRPVPPLNTPLPLGYTANLFIILLCGKLKTHKILQL